MPKRNVVLSAIVCSFFLFLIFPATALASTVTNQPDGTFLIDNQPFFPVGFWANNDFHGYNVTFEIPLSDWQDLAASGINFTMYPSGNTLKTSDPAGTFNQILTQTGLRVNYLPQYQDSAVTVADANKFGSNLLAYFALDEPEIAANCNISSLSIYHLLYQRIASQDPNHPIWSNHSVPVCNQTADQWRDIINIWNSNSGTTVNGLDFYSPAAGDLTGNWTAWTKQTNAALSAQISKNVGTLMIISAYNDRFGGYTFEDRLFNALTAIFNGANGLLFYTDSSDWATYRPTSAYTQVKQIASVLKAATPGILGSNKPVALSPSGTARAMLRQGTDNQYYLLLENPSANAVSLTVSQIPSDGDYLELATNQTARVASGSLAVTLPAWTARVFKQLLIQNPTGLSGDLNVDGRVDILDINQFLASPTTNFDYNLIVTNYGKSISSPGDLNSDGQVNIADLNLILANFTGNFNYNTIVANYGKGSTPTSLSTTITDFNNIVSNWGNTICGNTADLNKDCKVDYFDYNVLVTYYGR